MKAFPEIKYIQPGESIGTAIMVATGGMDLRDYFAAKALQGYLSEGTAFDKKSSETEEEVLARICYLQADAMMEARK